MDVLIKRNPLPQQFHTEPVRNCRIYLEPEGLSSPISNNLHPHQWCHSMPKMLDPPVSRQPIPSRSQKRTDHQYGTDSKKEFLQNRNLEDKFQCVMHKNATVFRCRTKQFDQYLSFTFSDTSFQHRLLCFRCFFKSTSNAEIMLVFSFEKFFQDCLRFLIYLTMINFRNHLVWNLSII